MKLRPAATDDLDALLELERECFAHAAYAAFPLRQFLDLCPRSFLVAEDADGVCGYTFGAMVSDGGRGDAWLLSLAVSQRVRGRGIGRLLSGRLLDELRALGAQRVRLTTEPGNDAAIALYADLGFREAARAPDYFGAGEPRVVLERRL